MRDLTLQFVFAAVLSVLFFSSYGDDHGGGRKLNITGTKQTVLFKDLAVCPRLKL